MPTEFDRTRFEEAYPPGIEHNWWHVARNRIIARFLGKHVPRRAGLLEVGCGSGIVTCHLHGQGWTVSGVDLGTPTNGLQCPDRLTLGQDAVQLPLDQRLAVGALLFFDVIEHIEDAPAFLRTMLEAFPNAGQVVVTVPARKELWTTFDDHYGHFRRYDRPLLEETFTKSGLRQTAGGYFFHGLYAAILLNILVRGRKRNIVFKATGTGTASVVNNLLGRCFDLESRVLPGSLRGSSIIAVAERNGRPS